MNQKPNPENPVRFGVFEADLNSGELRKSGVRLRLSGQPFQVLAVLLRNPGNVVSREDLKQELWPDDTFVDFENGVNTAIRKIRRVLDDSADTPRYVETLPRRGYRFIGQVEGLPRDGSLGIDQDPQAAQMPSGSPAPSPTAAAKGQQYLPWLLFTLTAVVLLVVSLLHFRQAPVKAPLRRFAFAPEDLYRGPVISPNGRRQRQAFEALLKIAPRYVAYTTRTSDQFTLWVQDLDQDEPRQLAGPLKHFMPLTPIWSPDSNFIAFRAGRELKKVSVQGGPATTLCELPPRTGDRFGSSWSPDSNWIVFNAASRLYQVPSQGGTPELAFEPDESEQQERFFSPHFLSDEVGGRRLLFVIGFRNEARLVAKNLDTGHQKVLGPGSEPFYSPTGHIVYQTDMGLWALPFSLETLTATGEPFPITENASYPSVAGDGTLLYREEAPVLQQLVWRDREGKKVGVIGRPQRVIRHPALSPDGSRVAVRALENENYDIWIHDVAQPLKIRLSFHPANEQRPAWTSSGDKIAFSSDRNGNHDIFVKSADASGQAELLLATPASEFDTDWSMDGQYAVGDDVDGDIWYVRAKEGATGYQKETFHGTQFHEIAPKLSPNGKLLAYESNESGQQEVYVRPFPEGSGKWPVSTRGGRSARWRRDGNELFYLEGDSLVAVSVTTNPTFSKGRATHLFDFPDTAGVDHPGHIYDVSADGQRFVFVQSLEKPPPPRIRVVLNWYEEFRDREQD